MLINQTPRAVREYGMPYALWLSGREALISIYGPYKLSIQQQRNPTLFYTKDF